MELKEFISDTITQIADGVSDAIKKSNGRGYTVNPRGNVCVIHFDLSVEGGMTVKIFEGSLSNRSINRISFDISTTLPNEITTNQASKEEN